MTDSEQRRMARAAEMLATARATQGDEYADFLEISVQLSNVYAMFLIAEDGRDEQLRGLMTTAMTNIQMRLAVKYGIRGTKLRLTTEVLFK